MVSLSCTQNHMSSHTGMWLSHKRTKMDIYTKLGNYLRSTVSGLNKSQSLWQTHDPNKNTSAVSSARGWQAPYGRWACPCSHQLPWAFCPLVSAAAGGEPAPTSVRSTGTAHVPGTLGDVSKAAAWGFSASEAAMRGHREAVTASGRHNLTSHTTQVSQRELHCSIYAAQSQGLHPTPALCATAEQSSLQLLASCWHHWAGADVQTCLADAD